MLLRHYLEQGVTKAALSRRLGVSRRTIHSWIESGQLERDLSSGEAGYSPRARVAHKLDPYKELIEARLGEFPRLSAQRLFDEVRATGYEVSMAAENVPFVATENVPLWLGSLGVAPIAVG